MVDVSRERFEELVAEALDSIPEELGRLMDNVAVVVEDRPGPDHRAAAGGNRQLLGLYQGVSLTRRSPLSYRGAIPDRITIFREAHCRITGDEDELRERVRVTVVHEVGHHFGISDARLRELGWT